MAAYSSEYQRQFLKDTDGTAKENYQAMLTFRRNRKSYEFRHTPIIWLDQNVVAEQEEAERNEKIKICHKERKARCKSLKTLDDKSPTKDKSVQVQPIQSDVAVQTPTKLRRSKRKSSPLKNSPKKKIPFTKHSAPIIAYGWADTSSMQSKRTFNVKAPCGEVRQSALSAAKQREKQKKLQQSKKERMIAEKLKKQAVVDSLTNFQQWQTEYQRQFCK